MKWLKSFWKSDPCYAENGVDGSDCSFQVYLSEIENWCPPLPSHHHKQIVPKQNNQERTSINTDFSTLQKTLEPMKLAWIKARITSMWPNWQKSANILATKLTSSLVNRPVKKV
jgi:alpha-1,3(6)-mannosylglycoprotein beta-1,6-N-acetyl-glucosaminyltransferase